MNRRSLFLGLGAMVALSACQPGLAPAAQEKTYSRDVLVRMWNVVTDMRVNGYAKPGLTPEAAKARIETAMRENNIQFPALIESTTPGGDQTRLVNMLILRGPEYDQLRLVFEYPGRLEEKKRGEIHSNPLLIFNHPTPSK